MACQHVRHRRQCLFGIERPKLLRQEFEFASGHEAAGGYRAPIGVHIGKRVASRIEAVETSADCEVDDPCARRDDAEGSLAADQMRQQRCVGLVDDTEDRYWFAEPEKRRNLRCCRAQGVEGGTHGRPAVTYRQHPDTAGNYTLARLPEIRVTAEGMRFSR